MISTLNSLSLTSLIVLICGVVILYLFLNNYILDPLRSVPGPFLARFTRWWYFFAIYKGDFERTNVELHKKYGPVVRIAPEEYSVDDVEGARVIYGLGKGFVKACIYFFSASFLKEDHNWIAREHLLIENRHHGTGPGCPQTQTEPPCSQT